MVRRELLRLSERVGRAAAPARATAAAPSSIKVRFADFTTITRSRTLRDATDVTREIYATALGLYDALGLDRARLRLVGVRVEGLVDARGGSPSSWCSARPSTAGATRTRPSTGRSGGSVAAPSGRPHWCGPTTTSDGGDLGPATVVVNRGRHSRSSGGRRTVTPTFPTVGFRPDRCLLMLDGSSSVTGR